MDLLDELSRRLRVAARGREGTITIAEIYQHLVPYRAVRAELGVLELAEYEHALLRLLAGEGGHVALADRGAREELERELASPNPILGVYRDYGATEARLAGSARAEPRATPAREDDRVPSPAPPEAPPAPAPATPAPPAAAATPPPTPRDPEATPPSPPAPARPAGCPVCRAALPEVEGVRYCPSCGAEQTERPCATCGALLRPDWRYCVKCGSERSAAGASPR